MGSWHLLLLDDMSNKSNKSNNGQLAPVVLLTGIMVAVWWCGVEVVWSYLGGEL